ncbi:hypothetical protein L204_105229 [Cryptococcus depauperatus]|nr:hypothetical protein L204_03879 [Cryptococcus depauperatus CBS 7855]
MARKPTASNRSVSQSIKPITPLKDKDEDSDNGTPTSTRFGRVVKKPQVVSPYFKSTGKTSKQVGLMPNEENENDDEKNRDAHEPTGMTSSEDNASNDTGSEDNYESAEEDGKEMVIEEDESGLDSDNLDEENEPKSKSRKRKAGKPIITQKASKKKVKSNDTSKVTKPQTSSHDYIEGYDDEDDDLTDTDLEEGQEIAGRIYPAPKTGHVPAGQISQNTLNFLKNLQIPERNDREWFRFHEPSFRLAEKEWKAFVGTMQLKLHEIDGEVPILPPRDIIHRIYRDIRFSSDKTPYKKSLCFTTSRGGRKGHWASYHLSISPNNRSLIAGGIWMPDKNQTASIRHRLLHEPDTFRQVIEKTEFVRWFGEAKEKKGTRNNVFGHNDALKVAPKGVDKGHKDIDLLKLRSVAVVHYFKDEEVMEPNFQEKVQTVARDMVPFVHMLNEFMTLPPEANNNNDDEN